jgi:hypothetical protein
MSGIGLLMSGLEEAPDVIDLLAPQVSVGID